MISERREDHYEQADPCQHNIRADHCATLAIIKLAWDSGVAKRVNTKLAFFDMITKVHLQ